MTKQQQTKKKTRAAFEPTKVALGVASLGAIVIVVLSLLLVTSV